MEGVNESLQLFNQSKPLNAAWNEERKKLQCCYCCSHAHKEAVGGGCSMIKDCNRMKIAEKKDKPRKPCAPIIISYISLQERE